MSFIPTNEPLKIRAGDTWRWRREDLVADYPAPTWSLVYRFKNAAGGFEINADADGAYHLVDVAPATTGAFAAGSYSWSAKVSDGTDEHTVDSGVLEVLPDLHAGTATAALDTRSHARKMLALVEAALEALNLGTKSYSIGSRSLTRRDIPELEELRDKYRGEVRAEELAERARNGLGGGKLVVKF